MALGSEIKSPTRGTLQLFQFGREEQPYPLRLNSTCCLAVSPGRIAVGIAAAVFTRLRFFSIHATRTCGCGICGLPHQSLNRLVDASHAF